MNPAPGEGDTDGSGSTGRRLFQTVDFRAIGGQGRAEPGRQEVAPRDAGSGGRPQGGRRRDPYSRRLADFGARLAQRAPRRDACGQDLADAPDGWPRRADEGPRAGRRHGRHRPARAAPLRRHGVSAIHQLPVPQRLREHRLAAARRRPSPRRDREARERSGEASEARALSRPEAAEPLRRSAAAHGHRARPRQGRRPRPSRRAPRQSRLQAARGAARGTAAHLRRLGRDLRLRDDGAAGGAAARRQHGDPRRRRA